jgi:hypothetical protein
VLAKSEFDRLYETGLHDDILKTLPQYNAVSPNRFDWFDSLDQDRFHAPYWHYQRLFGIGGSESLSCLQVHLGLQGYEFRHLDFFVNPWDVFRSKTLAQPLVQPTPAMVRGSMFEDRVKDLFIETFNGSEVKDLYSHLRPVKEYPWLVGNPDLFVQVGEELWLVDIKIPGEIAAEIPLGYISQLHHYRNLCTLNNITPDRMVLGVYDFSQGRVLPFQIQYNEDLSRDLLDGGNAFWKMIVRGEMPRFEVDPKKGDYEYGKLQNDLDVAPEDVLELEKLEASYIEKRARYDEFKAESDEISVMIRTILGRYAVGNTLPKCLSFSGISPRFTSEPNAEKVAELVSTGVISPNVFVPESVDIRGLIEAAKSAGVDVSSYVAGTKIDSKELGIELKKAGVPNTEVCDFSVGFAKARVSKKHQLSM